MKSNMLNTIKMAIVGVGLLGLTLAGCGGEGGGGPGAPGGDSGSVALSIKDAPLSSLQTFTIDVTKASLIDASGGSAPVYSGPAITVDLLGLQGFSQLIGSAQVPTGIYHEVEVEFSNAQATDTQSVAQNISVSSNTLTGVFSPPLTVTTGSTQSVQLDLDLQKSYVDLGGNDGLLTPYVLVDVLTATGVPLQRFASQVTAIDTVNDSFDADAFTWTSGSLTSLGNINVQCDPNTSYNDGQGNLSVGAVTSKLTTGDFVLVDGTLSGSGVDAIAVTAAQSGGPGGPGLPPQPTTLNVSGTITGVNLATDEVTVIVDYAFGAGSPPASLSTFTMTVGSGALLHRGGQTRVLSDFEPGNYCFAIIDPQTSEVTDLEDAPSVIAGKVTNINVGGGQGGDDLVELTPDSVNRIPVAQLPFVPSPLTIDLPTGAAGAVNDPIIVIAFFNGSAHLVGDPHWVGSIGNVPGGGTAPGGAVLGGELKTGTTAVVNAAGEPEFTLSVIDPFTQTMMDIDVTVAQGAQMTFWDASGNPHNLATAQDAVNELNNSPQWIEVAGQAGPTSGSFVADVALTVVATISGPTPPPNTHDILEGTVSGTAVINAAGDIEVTIDAFAGPGSPPTPVTATVRASAAMVAMVQSGAGTQLTVNDAVNELNASPVWVVMEGTRSGSTFDAHISLTIFK